MIGITTSAQPQPIRPPASVITNGVRHLFGAFFDAVPPIEDGLDSRQDDPLVDVVRRDPQAALRYIRGVMMCSGIGGAVVTVACMAFLILSWHRSGHCDRPLRWWLLGHALQQLSQVPVRFVFLSRIRLTEGGGGSLETCVASFTTSRAWKASRNVASLTYAWLVLGVVWTINAGDCSSFPGIYRMTVVVIVQAVCRASWALVRFRAYFPLEHDVGQRAFAQENQAATREDIESFTSVVAYTPALFDEEPSAECSICLGEYGECGCDGEACIENKCEYLRRLPCGHMFHSSCAERWLGEYSKRCPLCVRAIDEVAPKLWHRHSRIDRAAYL